MPVALMTRVLYQYIQYIKRSSWRNFKNPPFGGLLPLSQLLFMTGEGAVVMDGLEALHLQAETADPVVTA